MITCSISIFLTIRAWAEWLSRKKNSSWDRTNPSNEYCPGDEESQLMKSYLACTHYFFSHFDVVELHLLQSKRLKEERKQRYQELLPSQIMIVLMMIPIFTSVI